MAYTGSGTAADPYIVDNWADCIAAANVRYDVYVKWADKPESQKIVPAFTVSSRVEHKAQQIDFNGWTFEGITCTMNYSGSYPSMILEYSSEDIKYLNWHIEYLEVKDLRISMVYRQVEFRNAYFDYVKFLPFSSSSDFWTNGGQDIDFFYRAYFYNSVVRLHTEECNVAIPDGTYYNSELWVDYKYTGTTARKNKHCIFAGGPYLYESYLGGKVDVSEGTGSFAITPPHNILHHNIPGATLRNSIINIEFLVSEDCTISDYKGSAGSTTNFRYYSDNLKSYIVTNNGNNQDGLSAIALTLRCALGDIKNPDKMEDDSFPYIHDDAERYDQYVNDRNEEDWTWRQNASVNSGIPFNPFYFYPVVQPPEPAEDVEQNPYITVFDMQTAQDGFDNHGLAILCPTSSKIVEELNGEFNLSMTHPRDPEGKWQYLLEWNIIKALGQLYVIQKVDEVQTGGSAYVQVYAEHISYTLNDSWIFPPVTIAGYHGQTLIDSIMAQATDMGGDWQTKYNFDIQTDMDADSNFRDWYDMPDGVTPYEMILGSNGFISRIGGELYRDNFHIRINERMNNALDNAFEMAIGYNLTGIRRTVDLTTFCTYFRGYDVSDPETAYQSWFAVSWDPETLPRAYPRNVVRSQNFSYEYPEYAEGQLERDTMTFFNQNCSPLISYELSVKDLRRNPDYKMFTNNYRYKVGDRGRVWDERLQAWVELEITRTEKDAITGDCTKVVIGTQRSFTRPNGYTPIVPRAIIIPDAHIILEGNPPLYFNSNGDNLFDWVIYGAAGGVGDYINLFSGGLQNVFYSPSDGSSTGYNANWVSSNNAIEVDSDTEYTFSLKVMPTESMGLFTLEYDANMNFIGYGSTNTTSSVTCRTFTTSSTTKYVRFEVTNGSACTPSQIDDFNVNLGGTQLPYVSHSTCRIPVTVSDGTNTQTVDIIVNSKLYENDSIDFETTEIDIPTYTGNNTLTVGTTVQPRVKISYLEEES